MILLTFNIVGDGGGDGGDGSYGGDVDGGDVDGGDDGVVVV